MLEEIELTESKHLVNSQPTDRLITETLNFEHVSKGKNQELKTKDMIVVTRNGSIAEELEEEVWERNLVINDDSYDSENDKNDTDVLIKIPQVEAENESPQQPRSTCRSKLLYLLDILFSAFVSSPISGFFWYTIWRFTEEFVFIYSLNLTYFINYFIGFIVLAFAFLLQDCLQQVCSFKLINDY